MVRDGRTHNCSAIPQSEKTKLAERAYIFLKRVTRSSQPHSLLAQRACRVWEGDVKSGRPLQGRRILWTLQFRKYELYRTFAAKSSADGI